MTMAFEIVPARSTKDFADVATLFAGYASSLPVDLGYQDFASELADLPGKYAPPSGELFLARDAMGTPLGCVGLRSILAAGCCEMKRLFLLPVARGLGLGAALTETVIDTARAMGYHEVRLDTFPTMMAAMTLYERRGFQRIAGYYEPTPTGTVFMSLRL